MDEGLKRSIILDNYQNPVNFGLLHDKNYISQNMNNSSCIDEVNLDVLIDNNLIVDIRFDGEACAICTSSTSIMISTLINKNINEALTIIDNFEKMIDEQEYNKEILENAIVYDDIYKQPNRKKCALLAWWGLKKVLMEYINK